MSRQSTGGIHAKRLRDGTLAFELRFRARGRRERVTLHERAQCDCGCGGGWDERSARRELGNIVARVRVGVWSRGEQHPRVAAHVAAASRAIPSFHEYASYWLQAKADGVLGDKPIAANTRADYLWRLRAHLLPFFGTRRLDEIDADLCLAFKTHKIREASELRDAIAAGADLRDKRGRRIVPLAASSIRKLLDTLAAILDDAVEDGHIDRNPSRGKRMRVRVPKPQRTFLELDELTDLIDAAASQDAPPTPVKTTAQGGATATNVATLLSRGMSQGAIATELGLAKATVNYHVHRLGAEGPVPYIGRAFIARVLGYSGVRNSELCDLRIRHVRLHDPDGARFHIPDSKTEAGIRVVEISPDLAEAFVEHLDRMRRAGHLVGPDDYVVQNTRRGRMSRQRIAGIIREAATAASDKRRERGLPPLPTTTPHSLRRTYISIALSPTNST
jgi:integrase